MNKYLKRGRLEDVLCAIQYLSTKDYASLTAEKWTEYIKSKPSSANNSWGVLFDEHPEFFICMNAAEAGEQEEANLRFYSLLWRKAMPRNFHRPTDEAHTKVKIDELKEQKKFNLRDYGWQTLTSDQTQYLMQMAIQLHKNAVEQDRDSRWKYQFYVPIAVAIISAVITAVIQFYPKSFEKDIAEIKASIQSATTANKQVKTK